MTATNDSRLFSVIHTFKANEATNFIGGVVFETYCHFKGETEFVKLNLHVISAPASSHGVQHLQGCCQPYVSQSDLW
jgi:hypothetical protein